MVLQQLHMTSLIWKSALSYLKVFSLSRNLDWCPLQVGGVFLKRVESFNCFGVTFTSDRKWDKKLGCSIRQGECCDMNLASFSYLKHELFENEYHSLYLSRYLFLSFSLIMPISLQRKNCGHNCKSPKWKFCDKWSFYIWQSLQHCVSRISQYQVTLRRIQGSQLW